MTAAYDSTLGFTIVHDAEPEEILIAGFSQFGLAGLTAVDYLVDHLELEECGYLTSEHFPSITPFEDGRPRHHTQLFSRDDLDVTILVGELFVPVQASRAFSDAILNWMGDSGVEEVAILSGVPISHGPESHRVYYVATEDYRNRRFADTSIEGMRKGYLDGVNGALVERGIDSPLQVGVYVTPVHDQAPDVEAALRLLNALDTVYGIGIDTGPLETFAAEISRYYEQLTERLQDARKQELPEDRMYM